MAGPQSDGPVGNLLGHGDTRTASATEVPMRQTCKCNCSSKRTTRLGSSQLRWQAPAKSDPRIENRTTGHEVMAAQGPFIPMGSKDSPNPLKELLVSSATEVSPDLDAVSRTSSSSASVFEVVLLGCTELQCERSSSHLLMAPTENLISTAAACESAGSSCTFRAAVGSYESSNTIILEPS
ncbi:unnamed protein product [Pleuronectes platessa]|uniref:Uncharacterized protein n=1 Tax=Pleuronectes platessa TaxID=8262 RepID=A0A9N7TUD3_PLEPL|nr:unnamed protein product [Pleuronectes platessa]